jgi:hypothetical protein
VPLAAEVLETQHNPLRLEEQEKPQLRYEPSQATASVEIVYRSAMSARLCGFVKISACMRPSFVTAFGNCPSA